MLPAFPLKQLDFGLLFGKIQDLERSSFLSDWNRFSSGIALYLAPSNLPSTLTGFLVPADERHPHMMLPPPCFAREDDVLRVMSSAVKHSTLY